MPPPAPEPGPPDPPAGPPPLHASSSELAARLYADLRALAGSYFRPDHRGTLQPTALVHEAFVKLAASGQGEALKWESPAHFFAVAAKAMRQVLVDHARAAGTLKRSAGGARICLDGLESPRDCGAINVIDLDDALRELSVADPRAASLVELRFFAGMTVPEAAEVLGIRQTAAEEDWRFARAWLMNRLNDYGSGTEA